MRGLQAISGVSESAVSRRCGGGYRHEAWSPLARRRNPGTSGASEEHRRVVATASWPARAARTQRTAGYSLPGTSAVRLGRELQQHARRSCPARRTATQRQTRGAGPGAALGSGASEVCTDNYQLGRASIPATNSLSPSQRRSARAQKRRTAFKTIQPSPARCHGPSRVPARRRERSARLL
jgi:hypothetical protein